jgi:hypothetical protein
VTGRVYKNKDVEPVELNDIEIFFEPAEIAAKEFDDKYREVRFKVPLGIIINNKKNYTVASLYQFLVDDVLNSLKIMIKSSLSIRVLKAGSNLILQEFIK